MSNGSFWLPPAASSGAPVVDRLFQFIYWIAFVFFVLVVGLMVLFVLRYRRRPGREAVPRGHLPTHNTALELTWTIIPLILVGAIFYFGFTGFMDITTPPQNAYEVQVTGSQWKWAFTYPNGLEDEDLHVPANTAVRLTLTSTDVIHGFYIPDFRIKHDAVPGRYNTVWFRAPKPGTHDIYCTQFCGTGHSAMHAQVIVQPPDEFAAWLDKTSAALALASPVERGERLYHTLGCAQCHSINGSPGTAPTWKGLFGSTVQLSGGKTVVADEGYVRESILEPNAKVVLGFPTIMPTYQGRVKDPDILAIIAYMKTLK
jgi:cytochrome c oxidase subunit 2